MTPATVVTLLTDFGIQDPYAGIMHGVILSRCPYCNVVHLTHELAPQAVVAGAFLLQSAWTYFPDGTVHTAVVDPGVGTARRRIALQVRGHFFVGPDNGLLSSALPDALRGRRSSGEAYATREVAVPDGVRAVAIENPDLMLQPVSATFEGRDVFAPAAAYLAGGGTLEDLGSRVYSIEAFSELRAALAGSSVDGLVLQVDRFGNLITDIHPEDLPAGATLSVAGHKIPLAPTYGAAEGLNAIASSAGFLEIALTNGNASLELGAGRGASVVAS